MIETEAAGTRALSILSRKWTPAILRILDRGPLRFSTLQHSMPGVAHKVLIEHLRALETYHVIVRVPVAGAKHIGYELTVSGRELIPIVELAVRWTERPNSGERLRVRNEREFERP